MKARTVATVTTIGYLHCMDCTLDTDELCGTYDMHNCVLEDVTCDRCGRGYQPILGDGLKSWDIHPGDSTERMVS